MIEMQGYIRHLNAGDVLKHRPAGAGEGLNKRQQLVLLGESGKTAWRRWQRGIP